MESLLFVIGKCMGSIVWDDATIQFTLALVTRSNITIATSFLLFIVILVPQIGCDFLLFAIFDYVILTLILVMQQHRLK